MVVLTGSLVDSDTRVPSDCLIDAASEMEQSPEVGIMQFSSGVMQVVHTYFENGYALFKSPFSTHTNPNLLVSHSLPI